MKAPHLAQYQFRKQAPVSLGGGYLALIPCTALAVLLFLAPYITAPALRIRTL